MSDSIAPPSPPGGPPAAPSASQSPGQPPIGSSPATGATPNLGNAAKGIQISAVLLNGIAMVLPLVGPNTPLGMAWAKALSDVGRHVPPGAASPQGENTAMKGMMQHSQQMQSQLAAQRQQQQSPSPMGAGPVAKPPGAP